MRIRLSIPDHLVTPQALEAALEATSLANEQAIIRGEVPSLSDAISGGVRWRPEPYLDGEHFDLAHQVARRGWGDCDDLAPWLAGELRASGDDPGARPRVYATGKDRYHVVVETSDGEILDPSRWAGMGKRSAPDSRGVAGSVARPFAHRGSGALAVMPHSGKWYARCDLPWPDGSGHLASHARARSPNDALDQAIAGAVCCGEHIDSPLLDHVRGVGELLLTDTRDVLDNAQVGSIFGKIFKAIKGPIGWVVAPGLAMSAKTLTDKRFKGLRNMAANAAIPGAGGVLANAGDTLLSSLTHGSAQGKAPGGVVSPGGGMSVAIPNARDGGQDEGTEGRAGECCAGRPITLYYHPAGSIGPVVARF